jgi:hypothetical protein
MKRGVNLLLSVVIMVLGVVSAKCQEVDVPEDRFEPWGAIMAMVPNGRDIARESAALTQDARRTIADKRVEDKRRVLLLLDDLQAKQWPKDAPVSRIGYWTQEAIIMDAYFGSDADGIPNTDFFSEPKVTRIFLGHEFVDKRRQSQRKKILKNLLYKLLL